MKHWKLVHIVIGLGLCLPALSLWPSTNTLDLSGTWRFAMDPEDRGTSEAWYQQTLPEAIQLPGDLVSQGYGDAIHLDTPWMGSLFSRAYFDEPQYAPYREAGNIKVPFWLQPERYYAGAAWYQKTVEIPASWVGKRLQLTLERAHWKTTVWFGERQWGSDLSLGTAHVYDLGTVEESGSNTLTIRVDNSRIVDIGENSHSISDHTQGNWNGVIGALTLEALPLIALGEVQVYTALKNRMVRVILPLKDFRKNPTASDANCVIESTIKRVGDNGEIPAFVDTHHVTPAELQQGFVEIALIPAEDSPAVLAWDEFQPNLYEATFQLKTSVPEEHKPACAEPQVVQVRFGFREITQKDGQFFINGRKLFFRGTLECAIFPKTGHPPTDIASWRKVFAAVKDHGLNHVRFHSWCPPEAAFEVADVMGVYLQIEASSWPNQSTTLGDGLPVDAWLEQESQRILKTYGNHPSFVLMAAGNEPGGERHGEWLSQWLQRRQTEDPRRFYTSGSGWPVLAENDYHVTPEPRIQHWGEGLKSRINRLPPETVTDYCSFVDQYDVPVISHEIGQWCVYPNFDEISKYTGYLKPENFEIYRDFLEQNHLTHQAHDFLMASGKLQALCYKEDIESALRTPKMGGFQLLDLHDFPGQGTAVVGLLDPFWESKGYITAAEFRRFCGPVVPLAKLEKRIFTVGETLLADLSLAYYTSETLSQATPRWRLLDAAGNTWKTGELAKVDLTEAGYHALGKLELVLEELPTPATYRLEVSVEGADAGVYANDWDLWVYPEKPASTVSAQSLLVTSQVGESLWKHLQAGGKAILNLGKDQVREPEDGPVQLGFSTVFWNTAWTGGQAPHTMGILCDPAHPALAEFPTEFHSNWQWWYVIQAASAMVMNDLPTEIKPIVQVVDDWFQARKLALVFEVKVGEGHLMVSSVDLEHATDPVVRQLRASLENYLLNEDAGWGPDLVSIDPEQLKRVLRD